MIQLDLHKMLGVTLNVKNDNKRGLIYNGDMKVISSKWMLTQFLTYQRGKTKSIVKLLADAEISYQKLQENVCLRTANNPLIDYEFSIDIAIIECFQAFKALYDYIENTFCHAIPVKLGYSEEITQLLTQQLSVLGVDVKKYLVEERKEGIKSGYHTN